MNTSGPREELDLSIPNLSGDDDEKSVAALLHRQAGVHAMRVVDGGVWVEYSPDETEPRAIINALKDAGFEAILFQESQSGETGSSPI